MILDQAKSPDVVDTVLVGFRQRFDVSGRDGIEQQDLSLLAGHGEHRPAAQQIHKSYSNHKSPCLSFIYLNKTEKPRKQCLEVSD